MPTGIWGEVSQGLALHPNVSRSSSGVAKKLKPDGDPVDCPPFCMAANPTYVSFVAAGVSDGKGTLVDEVDESAIAPLSKCQAGMKLVPVIVTCVPPDVDPEAGLTFVMVGKPIAAAAGRAMNSVVSGNATSVTPTANVEIRLTLRAAVPVASQERIYFKPPRMDYGYDAHKSFGALA
jgi:hypothetical protein